MSGYDQIGIGLVGAGYAAYLHGVGYQNLRKHSVRLKTVVDAELDKAKSIQEQFCFEKTGNDFAELLQDPEITVIDICTPPYLHAEMLIQALKAGKHVICEKPLTGYFGQERDPVPIGRYVRKSQMYEEVIAQMETIKRVVEESPGKFFYAENFVYAAPVQEMAVLIAKKKSKILFMKGMISVKGSSSPVAGEWKATGGGCFARNGTHLLTALLYLKKAEAKSRGEAIAVTSVLADMGNTTACLSEYEHRHITANPLDVEDNAVVTVTFSDGTKALIIASDMILGGSRNSIDVFCNDATFISNLTPTDILSSYYLDEDNIEDTSIAEMLPSKVGWNKVFVADDVIRGHSVEIQHFIEAIIQKREPDADFSLAYDTTKIIYAAYQSAEEGRMILLTS